MRFRDLDATTGADRPSAVYSPCCRWYAAAELGFVASNPGAAVYLGTADSLVYPRLVVMPMSAKFWRTGGFYVVP